MTRSNYFNFLPSILKKKLMESIPPIPTKYCSFKASILMVHKMFCDCLTSPANHNIRAENRLILSTSIHAFLSICVLYAAPNHAETAFPARRNLRITSRQSLRSVLETSQEHIQPCILPEFSFYNGVPASPKPIGKTKESNKYWSNDNYNDEMRLNRLIERERAKNAYNSSNFENNQNQTLYNTTGIFPPDFDSNSSYINSMVNVSSDYINSTIEEYKPPNKYNYTGDNNGVIKETKPEDSIYGNDNYASPGTAQTIYPHSTRDKRGSEQHDVFDSISSHLIKVEIEFEHTSLEAYDSNKTGFVKIKDEDNNMIIEQNEHTLTTIGNDSKPNTGTEEIKYNNSSPVPSSIEYSHMDQSEDIQANNTIPSSPIIPETIDKEQNIFSGRNDDGKAEHPGMFDSISSNLNKDEVEFEHTSSEESGSNKTFLVKIKDADDNNIHEQNGQILTTISSGSNSNTEAEENKFNNTSPESSSIEYSHIDQGEQIKANNTIRSSPINLETVDLAQNGTNDNLETENPGVFDSIPSNLTKDEVEFEHTSSEESGSNKTVLVKIKDADGNNIHEQNGQILTTKVNGSKSNIEAEENKFNNTSPESSSIEYSHIDQGEEIKANNTIPSSPINLETVDLAQNGTNDNLEAENPETFDSIFSNLTKDKVEFEHTSSEESGSNKIKDADDNNIHEQNGQILTTIVNGLNSNTEAEENKFNNTSPESSAIEYCETGQSEQIQVSYTIPSTPVNPKSGDEEQEIKLNNASLIQYNQNYQSEEIQANNTSPSNPVNPKSGDVEQNIFSRGRNDYGDADISDSMSFNPTGPINPNNPKSGDDGLLSRSETSQPENAESSNKSKKWENRKLPTSESSSSSSRKRNGSEKSSWKSRSAKNKSSKHSRRLKFGLKQRYLMESPCLSITSISDKTRDTTFQIVKITPSPSVAPIIGLSSTALSPTNIPSVNQSEMPTLTVSSLSPRSMTLIDPYQSSSAAPTNKPTHMYSDSPSMAPTSLPVKIASESLTAAPTNEPTQMYSDSPSVAPTSMPTKISSESPSVAPTNKPSYIYSDSPSVAPTSIPTKISSESPSVAPTNKPTYMYLDSPSVAPTRKPNKIASESTSVAPTNEPSYIFSDSPSVAPNSKLTAIHSVSPSVAPTSQILMLPSIVPQSNTSMLPSDPPLWDYLCEQTSESRSNAILSTLSDMDSAISSNEGSGREQALHWILHLDPLNLCPDSKNLLQRYSLAVLYFSMNGGAWNECNAPDESNSSDVCYYGVPHNKYSWLTHASECDWFGISCDAADTVTKINLDGNGLKNIIPNVLNHLENLTLLKLDENEISGEITSQFIRLSKLQILDLSQSNISGTLPKAIGELPSLDELFIYGTDISGSIPESFCARKLTLFIADCSICIDSCCTHCTTP